LSLERALETLVNLGLTQTEAQAYVFLAKTGPQDGRDLANALKITEQQLYLTLKTLQNKGFINSTLKRHVIFSVVPLEEILNNLIKAKTEEAQRLRQNKEDLLSHLNH
jgi:sugar-specific transcriptional regulator TrmB